MRSFRLLLIGALFLSISLPALAQRVGHGNAKNSQTADDGTDAAAGQQAAVDPKTGKLRQPTADEVRDLTQSLQPALSQSSEGLVEVRHPDGSVSVDLQGRFQDAVLAKVNPDGSVEQHCVTTVKEAEAFLTAKPVAKPAPAKKSAKPATANQAVR
jgi:hypothetical protein